ncbi:hypothetical protein KKD70_02285, partial [Patescibacteria group bacterium]|nr:hypothetical protein [Patescibacteria group bacterium]
MADSNVQNTQVGQVDKQPEIANVPSWLKKGMSGGEVSSGQATEPVISSDETSSKEAEKSKADLPAWVRNAGGDDELPEEEPKTTDSPTGENDVVPSQDEIVPQAVQPKSVDTHKEVKQNEDSKSIFDNLKNI